MAICIKCGNLNSDIANYCEKCNFLLPKIGIDEISSASRGYVELKDENVNYLNTGLYSGLNQILMQYVEKNMDVHIILKAIQNSTLEITDLIDKGETNIRNLERETLLPDEVKEIMISPLLEVIDGLDLMLKAYDNGINYLKSTDPGDIEEILSIAREADRMIIKGKDDFLKIINKPEIQEFNEIKNYEMEDLFYKKKNSIPQDIYSGDHISFDI